MSKSALNAEQKDKIFGVVLRGARYFSMKMPTSYGAISARGVRCECLSARFVSVFAPNCGAQSEIGTDFEGVSF